ncbi:hypothetical protein MRB53_007222 [Persea americana]|uniref:Uncharacterized protein n=1 Tax=Persea americana TaxID=3435 RepID=A0ACC2MID7_PERAE|nr:hypothetical protein MRB53_007222 [Persea americana]
MVGSSEDLFISVAKELAEFISTEDESFRAPDGRRKELGFTVLFPVDQGSDSSDICIEWTKVIGNDRQHSPLIAKSLLTTPSSLAGKDVVAQINRALEKNGVDMLFSTLVNDTIGTLARDRYFSIDTVAAVTLGMGTNAAYVERALEIPKCHGPLPLSRDGW